MEVSLSVNVPWCSAIYRVFSIKRPRRLFKTWHGGSGVSLNQQFIWARHYLRKGYYLFFLAAVYLALKSLVYYRTNKRLRVLIFTIPCFIPGVYSGPGV